MFLFFGCQHSGDVHTEAFFTVDHQHGDFLNNSLKQEESDDENFLCKT